MEKIINYQVYQGNTYGVEYVLNHRATSSDVNEFGADEVVLATGSIQREPKGLTNSDQVISARDFVSNFDQYTGKKVVLIDEDFSAPTYGVADLLAKNFNKVVLVTSRPRLAGNVNHCSAIGVFRRLYSADIDIRPAQETIGFSSSELVLKNPFSQVETTISEVDLVVYSTPRISTDDLAPEISAINLHRIGDCRSPRNLLTAIQGGHALALDL
jgi:thioredoxin reductase